MLSLHRIAAPALLAAVLVGGGLVGGGLATNPAAAAPGDDCDLSEGTCDSGAGQTTEGGNVTVTVFGTMVGPGSGGSDGSGSPTVQVPVPCYYTSYFNGAEYFEYIDSGRAESEWNHLQNNNTGSYEPYQAPDGWRQHEKDTEGAWYGGICRSATFDGDIEAFFDFAADWFDDNGHIWVPAGGQPPVPPIPPEVLLQAATDAMEVPEPVFDRNPKRNGDESSIVNLDTWFWQETDSPTTGSVTAEAGPSSATVQIGLDQVTYASPEAGEVTCSDGGTPYSPGAASDCVLTFPRAGETTVTANSIWNGSWTFNGEPQGDIEPVPGQWQTPVGVAEIQSLVTDVD